MLLEDNKGFCPWCKQGTAFALLDEIYGASPWYLRERAHAPAVVPPAMLNQRTRTGLRVYRCRYCDKTIAILEQEIYPIGGVLEGRVWRTMVAPAQSPRKLDASAPESVQSFYEEASQCENAHAYRGAAVLYRAAVEELVKDQGATKGKLYDRIESLRPKLSDDLVDDLHEARILGNDSIHEGIKFSAEEVEDVAGLIEEAVLALYVQPDQKRAMREARRNRRDAARAKES